MVPRTQPTGTEEMTRSIELLPGIVSRAVMDQLRQYSSEQGRALSVYVDVDAERWGSAEAARIAAKNALLEARRRIETLEDLSAAHRHQLLEDVERAREIAEATAGRRRTRSLAIFADHSQRYGLAIPLPWPVRPRWFVDQAFVTWPLEQMLHLSEKYCICLTDKDDARIFVFYMGAIEERTDIVDEIPGRIRYPDPFRELEYMRKHVEYFHKHFDHTAQALFDLYQREGFDHLVVGGLHEVLPQFERHLHSYLRDKVIARWDVPVQTISLTEVLERTEAEERRIEDAHARRIWKQIEERGPARSSHGPEEVFQALWQHRVHALLVDPELRLEAGRCGSCLRTTLLERCPECGSAELEKVDGVTEAVTLAIETGAIVKYWERSAELAGVGHMATLNRF